MSETFKLVKILDPITVTNVTGGLSPKGIYNPATTYAIGDEVSYNGSSYVLYTLTAAGTLPTDTTKWSVLASKGDPGAAGANGTTIPIGGSTTQVQYNLAGAFAGSAGLTYDGTNLRLNVGQTLNTAITTGSPSLVLSGGKLTKGLAIQQSATAGTFNMLELQRSDGNNSTWFDSGATLRMATNASVGIIATNNGTTFSGALSNAQVQIQAANSGSIGMSVFGASGQTVEILTLHNSAGAKLSSFDAAGSLYLGTTASLSNYNLGDPAATNYERVREFWSSNVFSILAEAGGTGSNRNIQFGSGTSTIMLSQNNNTKLGFALTTNASIAASMTIASSFVGASAAQIGLGITNTYNQTGTASSTDFVLNRVHTAIGSGTHLFMDMQVGGVSQLSFTTNGTIRIGTATTLAPTGSFFQNSVGMGVPAYAYTSVLSMGITSGTNKGFVMRANGSQSVNLLELQNSAGAQIAAFNSASSLLLTAALKVGYNTTALTTATSLTVDSPSFQDADATAAAFNVTPPSTTVAGIQFTVSKIDASANVVTLVGTYNGQVNPTLSSQWKYMSFVTTNVAGVFRIVSNN